MGQRIVSLVQERYAADWRADLRDVRSVLTKKRAMLTEQLPPTFAKSLTGTGMFAHLPLSSGQIAELKEEKVFLATDGRINIAGIPLDRIAEFAEKIRKVKND